nr:NAD(P)-dependent oxidoreductase [Boseongicola sp. H5]
MVLGATGRLGQMLRWAWRDRPGFDVTWQTRRAMPSDDWLVLDPLTEPERLRQAASGRDAVVVLAGVVPGRTEPMSDNTRLALAAVNAVAEDGPHVFLASSAAVYGCPETPCRETTLPRPTTHYGHAKLRMERAARARIPAVTCLRIGNVAGADALLRTRGQESGPVALDHFPDGRSPSRSYIGPASFARVLAELIEAGARGVRLPPTLNIAAPEPVEMADLLEAAAIPWETRPAPPDALARLDLDVTRLSKLVSLPVATGTPASLIAEWRTYPGQGGAIR